MELERAYEDVPARCRNANGWVVAKGYHIHLPFCPSLEIGTFFCGGGDSHGCLEQVTTLPNSVSSGRQRLPRTLKAEKGFFLPLVTQFSV